MLDFSIDKNNVIIKSDLDFVLQQIDILFGTYHGEVFGDINYGTDYDRYLYNLKISNSGLKSRIISDMNSLDLRGYEFDVDVYFLEGSERDIAMIDINLYKDNQTYNRIYKIS